MSIIPLSVVMATLLAASSLTAFADSPNKHEGTTTGSEASSSQPSTSSAPSIEYDDVADMSDDNIPAVGRTGSHSMHPAVQGAEQSADDEVKAFRKTEE